MVALAVGFGSSWLAGQSNAPPTYSSPNVVNDAGKKLRSTQVPRRTSSTNQSSVPNRNGQNSTAKTESAKPAVESTKPVVGTTRPMTPAPNATKRDSGVVPASHEEFAAPISAAIPNGVPVSPELPPQNLVPSPLSPSMSSGRPLTSGANVGFPGERTVPPQVTGSHLGLLPGETATERSLRLMNVITDLEQQIAELTDINAKLNADLKAKEAKLQSGALQFNAARKELSLAAEEFQRLRKENAALRDKYRTAERENASLMRSLSPLLKQILQGDDESQAKD